MRQLIETQGFGRIWAGSPRDWRTPGKTERLINMLQGEDLEFFRRVCADLPCPRKFMEEHGDFFGWTPEMVAKARIFTARPLPSPVRYFEKSWHCYENSRDKALREGILYVEGLAIAPSGPHIHAWNSTDGVNVIDLTWPYQHVNKYLGFVFDIEKEPDYAGLLGRIFQRELEKG